MTSTRREFLGAVLTVLAWLGLGTVAPKTSATTDLPFEGEIDFCPVDSVVALERTADMTDAAKRAAAHLGELHFELLDLTTIVSAPTSIGYVVGPGTSWIKIACDDKANCYGPVREVRFEADNR